MARVVLLGLASCTPASAPIAAPQQVEIGRTAVAVAPPIASTTRERGEVAVSITARDDLVSAVIPPLPFVDLSASIAAELAPPDRALLDADTREFAAFYPAARANDAAHADACVEDTAPACVANLNDRARLDALAAAYSANNMKRALALSGGGPAGSIVFATLQDRARDAGMLFLGSRGMPVMGPTGEVEHPFDELPIAFTGPPSAYGTSNATASQAVRRATLYGVAKEAWLHGDAAGALAALRELAPIAGPELLPEVELRIGLAASVGPNADYARAADALRHALASSVPLLGRSVLAKALALAEYRHGDWARALEAAITALDDPATRPQPGRHGRDFEDFGIVRIAADAVERQGGVAHANLAPASRSAYAAIVGALASRALYRGDREAARTLADDAIAHEEQPVASRVRAVLAAPQGYVRSTAFGGPAKEPVAAERSFVDGVGFSVEQIEADVRRGERPIGPSAGRAVASLVRLCLEPLAWRIPRGSDERIELVATVSDAPGPSTTAARPEPGGPALHDTATDGDAGSAASATARGVVTAIEARTTSGAPTPGLAACLEELGKSVLASSPASVRATIDLSALHDRP